MSFRVNGGAFELVLLEIPPPTGAAGAAGAATRDALLQPQTLLELHRILLVYPFYPVPIPVSLTQNVFGIVTTSEVEGVCERPQILSEPNASA